MFSLGEVGIGISQITDGAQALKQSREPNKVINNSNSLLGVVAYANEGENAEYWDLVGSLLPGALSGGNIKAVVEGVESLKNGDNVLNVLEGVDAALDIVNAGGVAIGAISDNSEGSSTSSSGSYTYIA